jgi:hypothetical protein
MLEIRPSGSMSERGERRIARGYLDTIGEIPKQTMSKSTPQRRLWTVFSHFFHSAIAPDLGMCIIIIRRETTTHANLAVREGFST